jgi:hypothetical protein
MDKLMSYEDLQVLCIERGNNLIEANAKILDTMREVERLREALLLAKENLCDGRDFGVTDAIENALNPSKQSEKRNNCPDCGWNHPVDACGQSSKTRDTND